MNYNFDAPDAVMVGTRGAVGQRLFLLQVRQGRRLVIVKMEKQALVSLAAWLAQQVKEIGRPGHLPDPVELEPEYEVDFVAGDIAISVADGTIELTVESLDEEDELSVILSPEWAATLSIAITRLVEQGRPPCPLCGGPLDPRGHDCPRTNGFAPPLR